MKKGIVNDKRLMVHHIVELKDDWKQRLNTNNLVTICTACHNHLDHKH
ncbi:HNH endonuclease [Mammaliicoccus vitulinus]